MTVLANITRPMIGSNHLWVRIWCAILACVEVESSGLLTTGFLLGNINICAFEKERYHIHMVDHAREGIRNYKTA